MAGDDKHRQEGGELPGMPRRSEPRHTLRRAVQVRCAHWDTYVKLYTTNISRGGMLLKLPDKPEPGTAIHLKLHLPDGGELSLDGRVVRVGAPRPGESLNPVGVALDMSDEVRAQLDEYLSMALSWTAEPEEEDRSELETPRPGEAAFRGRPGTDRNKRETLRPLPDSDEQREIRTLIRTMVPERSTNPIIGIDFGTSNCAVAIARDDDLTLFDDDGTLEIPSVVWFRGRGDYVVGLEAREQMATDPTRTVPSIKRLLGCSIDDPYAAPFLMSLACPGRSGPNKSIVFEINGEELTPVQIAAIILRHIKSVAERKLGTNVDKAVMAFPLAFGERPRDDLVKAAKIAGLELVALIPEPAAAAMAYGRRGVDKNEIVGVYDFGGGTFDFCVLDITGNVLRVLGAAGDLWLGGDDLDQALAKAVADEFWRATNIDVRKRAAEWQRVVQACEEAKRYLSLANEIDVYVPGVAVTSEGPVDLSVPVTADRLEELTADLVDATLSICEEALKDATIRFDDISEMLLIGGTSRLPSVRKAVHMMFRRDPHPAVHPERAVVIGAAVKAAEVEGRKVHKGTWPGLVLQELSKHAVGLAMAGGSTEPVITKSTPLPAVERRIFSTHRDRQTELILLVVEGEAQRTRHNKQVGQFRITGLPPRPAGSVDVEVIFEMDESEVLTITARELSSGNRTTERFEFGS